MKQSGGVCVFFSRSATDSDVPSLFSQKSRESHTGLATSAGHHLHALLCESGGGRHLTNCFHLFQLLFAVFPGENKDNDARVTLANARQKQQPTHSESCCLLMHVIAELHFFQDDFSGYGPSYRKMMWSSIPAVLEHNMSLLPARCSQLTGLTGSCGHDCSSMVFFFF